MTRLSRLLTFAALLISLTAAAGCGNQGVGSSGTSAAVSHQASGAERAEIEQAFLGYHRAVVAGRFDVACGLQTPDATAKLLQNMRTKDPAVDTCEKALATERATPNPADPATAIVKTARIVDVQVRDDEAVLSWSGEVGGVARSSADNLRRIDGSWRLADLG